MLYETSLDSEYYCKNVLADNVLPKIRAAVLVSADQDAGKRWAFMRDLASPRAAFPATKPLKRENVRILPWIPKGADVNPLDVFVWDSIKDGLRVIPLEQRNNPAKLKAASTKTIANLSADPLWAQKVKRTCLSIPKRLKWNKGDGAKPIVGKPWRKFTLCAKSDLLPVFVV